MPCNDVLFNEFASGGSSRVPFCSYSSSSRSACSRSQRQCDKHTPHAIAPAAEGIVAIHRGQSSMHAMRPTTCSPFLLPSLQLDHPEMAERSCKR